MNMADRNFNALIQKKWQEGKFVSVGLDTDYDRLPVTIKTDDVAASIVAFNTAIIDATKDLVCAYKPNPAFYEASGAEGIAALKETCNYIRSTAPDVAIIIDAKRADIGNTNIGYARFAFDYLGGDAITLHPYLGHEAIEPFVNRPEKGVIVLCRTSNEGSGEFQDLLVDGKPLYEVVAQHVVEQWNEHNNCSLVVGATYPEEIAAVRAIAPTLPFLIPGIGAQGGDLEATVKAAQTADGTGMIINSSRGILFASSGEDFAEAARAETQKLHDQIAQYL
jgi:orotidine-5'-phosphate decarboxylase